MDRFTQDTYACLLRPDRLMFQTHDIFFPVGKARTEPRGQNRHAPLFFRSV